MWERTSRTVAQGSRLQVPLTFDPVPQYPKTASSRPQLRYRPDRLDTPAVSHVGILRRGGFLLRPNDRPLPLGHEHRTPQIFRGWVLHVISDRERLEVICAHLLSAF